MRYYEYLWIPDAIQVVIQSIDSQKSGSKTANKV